MMKYTMQYRVKGILQLTFCLAVFFLPWVIAPSWAANTWVGNTASSEGDALRLGESIYLSGTLPSGEQVQAKLLDRDVTASGKSVACVGCHLRSGLGSLINDEILVLPVSGTKLYAPLLNQFDIPGTSMKRTMFNSPRPAYTDESLAAALLTGKDPTGRDLDEAMPRYLFPAGSTPAIVTYLKNLSTNVSPGLAEDEIRFATIVTEGISDADREAMVRPLTAFLQEEWNDRLLVLAKRSNTRVSQGNQPLDNGKHYRRASLDVWELHGPSETWAAQLETFYGQRPVFAILGGIAAGEWSPIHQFCEKNKIPCIFPNTDLPVVAASDWHTLYFSKGFFLEGEVAARFLAEDAGLSPATPVIQVSRKTEQGKALARGFSDTWQKISKATLTSLILSDGEHTGSNFWQKLSASTPPAALVVWLTAADLAGIGSLADRKPPALFLSATLLSRITPGSARDGPGFHLYRLSTPPSRRWRLHRVHDRQLDEDEEIFQLPAWHVSSKIFFLKSMLSNALMELGEDLYRDYFLDILDEAGKQATSSLTYPLLSFGPGDRYAAKGCYIVQLTAGEKPELLKKVDWLYYAGQE